MDPHRRVRAAPQSPSAAPLIAIEKGVEPDQVVAELELIASKVEVVVGELALSPLAVVGTAKSTVFRASPESMGAQG
jgi:hypothetical protein